MLLGKTASFTTEQHSHSPMYTISSTMERPVDQVASVTPPTTMDAQQNISTSSDLQQPSMQSWMPQMGMSTQEHTETIPSQVPCCSSDHYPATTVWDHSITPRSTLPAKPGLYPGQLPQSLVKDGKLARMKPRLRF